MLAAPRHESQPFCKVAGQAWLIYKIKNKIFDLLWIGSAFFVFLSWALCTVTIKPRDKCVYVQYIEKSRERGGGTNIDLLNVI
jgi:hypothetical protein